MAYLGQASLQPYAGHILRMAGQRIPGLPLLRGAPPGKSAGLKPQAGMVSFLHLEFAVVLPGWVLVAAGFSQPLEWAEFPLVVDAFVVLAFILMVFEFVLPFLKARLSDLYVSAWYIIGGIIFTMLAYPVGNFVPELVPGARGRGVQRPVDSRCCGSLRDAVCPCHRLLRHPRYHAPSHLQSFPVDGGLLGALLYLPVKRDSPLRVFGHPMAAQKGAIVASAYLGMDVTLVVTNLLLSLRGSSGIASKDVPLRFVWFGVVSYLLVGLQGSVQALMPVNRIIHFTDWVIGHSHLAMIGLQVSSRLVASPISGSASLERATTSA